ncbi:MAG TPA: SPFH domain-containing protein [Stellaceae bacterium]|nr:SPFH domain-containing protein [Stellaceae bacterium]
MQLLSGIGGLFTLTLIIVTLIIWAKPIMQGIRMSRTPIITMAAVASTLVLSSTASRAYYDKNDFTEAYTILPNESAFWIPDVGANKDNQAQLESEAYLNANKVALKRFIVPHIKLQGSGTFFDFYVPSGRLIIVDRTPFSREWVDAHDRGTSARKEGFPCQSKEGINITVGVAIGASVTEANAAKYLYHFGVIPPRGDRKDPQVIFNSVFYSRSVKEVMDDFGRKKVSEIICDQITARSFDKANEEAKVVKDNATKSIADYFATLGITIDFVGWADTFTFDKDVQDAVNRRYIAKQDQEIAASLAPYAATIQALAIAQALRSFGDKTDGKLPTTIVGLPTELGALLGTAIKNAPIPTAAPSR